MGPSKNGSLDHLACQFSRLLGIGPRSRCARASLLVLVQAVLASGGLCACDPERQTTGIVHTPGERERAVAEVRAELAARRAAENQERERLAAEEDARQDAREQAEMARRQEERARRQEQEQRARCEQQRQARAKALAGLEADVAKVKEAGDRRARAEKWIAARCRTIAQKVFSTELYTDAQGHVRRRQVETGTENPFQACPAKTPEDIATEGGLSYDDDYGWTRAGVPALPKKPEEYRAIRTAEINSMVSPDCSTE